MACRSSSSRAEFVPQESINQQLPIHGCTSFWIEHAFHSSPANCHAVSSSCSTKRTCMEAVFR
eukprot:scaffold17492_cov131-Skeletonema_marinoi.AAC.1